MQEEGHAHVLLEKKFFSKVQMWLIISSYFLSIIEFPFVFLKAVGGKKEASAGLS
jgi:hypothetical protein